MLTAPAGLERVAHRGSPRERMENTLPGFVLALEHGADAVELDVHATADGVAVVHHDADVSGRPIIRTNWSELALTDLGNGARIPTLQDVLLAIGDRATVYVELKGSGVEAPAIATVRQFGRRYALHSFDHDAIARAAGLAPEIARGVLLDRGTASAPGVLRAAVHRTRARDVWPHWTLVDTPLMDAARQANVRVIPWTVNSADVAGQLAQLGVAAVCTDDVRLLAKL